jgi:hypothetical protein
MHANAVRVCVRDRASIGLNSLSEEKRSPLSKTEKTKRHADGRDDLPGQAAKKGTAAESKKKKRKRQEM